MRDYSAGPAMLQIIIPQIPDLLRDFWLTEAKKLFPYLAVAVGKLNSAHATPFSS